MEKIYTRNRFRFSKIKFNKNNGKIPSNKSFVLFKVIMIFIIEIVVARALIKAIVPITEKQCSAKAKSIATTISNDQATIVMNKYKYEDLATVEKDNNGKIQMIKLNIVPVNEITSDIGTKIQNELNNVDKTSFGIRLGSFTGIKMISGRGPYVNIRMSTIGNVETELKSEFKTAGINQTLHQIYLEISCEVSILTPYKTTSEEIKNQVLIAESIIVGEIPNSYYDMNGSSGQVVVRNTK